MYLQKENIDGQRLGYFPKMHFQKDINKNQPKTFKTDIPETGQAKYFLPRYLVFQPVQIGFD